MILFDDRKDWVMIFPGTVDFAINPEEMVAIRQLGQEDIPGSDFTVRCILKLSDDPIDFGLVNPLIAM